MSLRHSRRKGLRPPVAHCAEQSAATAAPSRSRNKTADFRRSGPTLVHGILVAQGVRSEFSPHDPKRLLIARAKFALLGPAQKAGPEPDTNRSAPIYTAAIRFSVDASRRAVTARTASSETQRRSKAKDRSRSRFNASSRSRQRRSADLQISDQRHQVSLSCGCGSSVPAGRTGIICAAEQPSGRGFHGDWRAPSRQSGWGRKRCHTLRASSSANRSVVTTGGSLHLRACSKARLSPRSHSQSDSRLRSWFQA